MSTAQDKLKALLAKKKGLPTSTPSQESTPTVSNTPATLSTKDKIAALRAKKSSTSVTLTAVPTEAQVPEVADPTIEGVLTKFKATDEMYQIDGFDPDIFMDALEKLETNVVAKAPGIGEYLQGIHRNLSKYPELMHLLDDEQIHIVVSGLLAQTNTELAIKATKTKSTKKSAPITLDMAEALF